MSKKSNTVQVETNESVTPETKVETTKTFPIPLDGSGAVEYIKEQGNVSKAIRELAKTYSRGEVAKMLNKRYQHVRNVLITPVKKSA